MKAKLFCKTGILSGKSIEIGESATIGKGAENDLELNAQFISSRHARIFFDKKENCYFLEDLRSRNGTKLDGMKMTQKEKLGALHVITFPDNFDFIFQVIDAGAVENKEASPPSDAESRRAKKISNSDAEPIAPGQGEKDRLFGPATGRTILDQEVIPFPNLTDLEKPSPASRFGELTSSRAGKQDQRTGKTIPGDAPIAAPQFQSDKSAAAAFVLEVKAVGKEKETFLLREGENLIGRSQQCPICIDDPSLSRQHALLTIRAEKATLRDLESKNHTYVDKKRVTSEVEVGTEMKIQFGTVEAQIVKR